MHPCAALAPGGRDGVELCHGQPCPRNGDPVPSSLPFLGAALSPAPQLSPVQVTALYWETGASQVRLLLRISSELRGGTVHLSDTLGAVLGCSMNILLLRVC